MSTFVAFILGLLFGWIIEWVIDWIYWRRRNSAVRMESVRLQEHLKGLAARNAELERKLAQQSVPAVVNGETRQASLNVQDNLDRQAGAAVLKPDDLILIKGIGPVIAQKLNQAGITTFAELGALTPDRLRELVGDVISRLANEEDILAQARRFAADTRREE